MNVEAFIMTLLEADLPKVGDVVRLVTGVDVEIIDVGPFQNLKAKYPEAAARALEDLPIPESSLKTAWVMKDKDGQLWMTGSASMRLFVQKILGR